MSDQFPEDDAPATAPTVSSKELLGSRKFEMREEKPTGYLRFEMAQLYQEWEQHWASWEGNYWKHTTKKIWRRVPSVD